MATYSSRITRSQYSTIKFDSVDTRDGGYLYRLDNRRLEAYIQPFYFDRIRIEAYIHIYLVEHAC